MIAVDAPHDWFWGKHRIMGRWRASLGLEAVLSWWKAQGCAWYEQANVQIRQLRMHWSKRRLLFCCRFFFYFALEGITLLVLSFWTLCVIEPTFTSLRSASQWTLVNFLSFPPLLDCIILSSSPCNDAESTGVTQCRNTSFIASLGLKTGQFSGTCCPRQPHKQIMHRF